MLIITSNAASPAGHGQTAMGMSMSMSMRMGMRRKGFYGRHLQEVGHTLSIYSILFLLFSIRILNAKHYTPLGPSTLNSFICYA